MIFSVWQPDGGYKYYESGVRHGIGDDLPDVDMPPPIRGIGAPAQKVGRPLPADARYIGRGRKPRGVLAPADASGIQGLSGTTFSQFGTVGALFAGAALGIVFYEGYRRYRD